jgi:hypothetical protein
VVPRTGHVTAMSRQDDLDNHANQCNPEHEAYWESRGYDEDEAQELAEAERED